MPNRIYRSAVVLSITALLVSLLTSVASAQSTGAGLPGGSPQTSTVASKHLDSSKGTSEAKPADVAADVITIEQSEIAQKSSNKSASKQQTSGSTQSSTPANTIVPLTTGKKFTYFLRSSFMPPTPYAFSLLSGVFSEATDNDHGRHMTAGDFMADSLTHAARSMAFRTTSNFFEKFAYASAFKQDPRYHRSDKKGFARVSYAVSRVFITRSDSGHDQFNVSFLAGGMTAAGISNLWVRDEDRGISNTMGRFGLHVGYKALSNVISELFRRH